MPQTRQPQDEKFVPFIVKKICPFLTATFAWIDHSSLDEQYDFLAEAFHGAIARADPACGNGRRLRHLSLSQDPTD